MDFNQHMAASPNWVVYWMALMGGVMIAAIPFAIKDWRARFAILAMIGNLIVMGALFDRFGYTRILGLAHIIFWTPLLAYYWKTRNAHPDRIWTGRWVKLAMVIIFISLLFDYTDVLRYLLGNHSVMSLSNA